jgi:hypothetical protein
MQNGAATLSLLPSRGAEASASRRLQRESRRVIAIQGLQLQKGEPAAATPANQSRSQPLLDLGLRIGKPGRRFASVAGNLGVLPVAGPAIEARKGRARKKGRTNRSCIAG